MQNPPLAEQKSDIRKSIRDQLNTQSGAEKHLASLSIVRQLYHWIAQHPEVKTIAIYAALKNEPELEQLQQMAEGIEFVYPLSHEEGQMQFHKVNDHSELKAGRFGILEPNPGCHPETPPSEIDAFFCPGVAFTHCGKRIGKGGGYYDRLLENRKAKSQLIGVAFQCQLLADLPSEAHDIRMDQVISA
jgi:5-formyltetrahydrofolate cyclo-ligase